MLHAVMLCTPTPFTDSTLMQALRWLRDGSLVAFPTETVYGLGADATHDDAVQAIYHTKGRPSFNPLIVHVTDRIMAERYALFDARTARLADALWPDAVTLIMPVRPDSVSPHLLAGGTTIALRAPNHPIAQALIAAFNGGIAAPSANRSGKISPTTAEHVCEEFMHHQGTLRMIIDGGHASIGLESTVIDCTTSQLCIVRSGSISAHVIETLTGEPCAYGMHHTATLPSPGLLSSHYAPSCSVRLYAHHVEEGEALLAFGACASVQGIHQAISIRNLSEKEQLEEAAYHFYDYLRSLDHLNPSCIAVMPIPEEGIGIALNDRLRRAASARG